MSKGSSAPSADPLLGTLLGRYQLVRVLGEGGMGVVYEALHQDLGKRAALKTLRSRRSVSAEARKRFLREGQAAARIRHQNVADVYDVSLSGVTPYLVMELLDGEDLAHYLAKVGKLPLQQAADVIVPVIAAVEAAHRKGLVHRDLKPGNIFLARIGGSVVPKVLDFGISKVVDSEPGTTLTNTGAFLGTPHYMSPEQALGSRDVSARSDQYSLGVILYQCVTGRRPLDDSPMYALMHRTIHGEIPAPRQFEPELPEELEAIILRAMAQDSRKRFDSARSMGETLLPFASNRIQSDYESEFSVQSAAPQPLLPGRESSTLEQASTLGESVQVRALAPRRTPRAKTIGIFAAGLLVVGTLASFLRKQEASIRSQPAVTRAVEIVNSVEAPSTPKELVIEQQNPPAPVGAITSTSPSPSTPIVREYVVLRQRAQKQLSLWLHEPSTSNCAQAKELWRIYQALIIEEAERQVAQRALNALGGCTNQGAKSPPSTSTGQTARPQRSPVEPRSKRKARRKSSPIAERAKTRGTEQHPPETSPSPFLSFDGD